MLKQKKVLIKNKKAFAVFLVVLLLISGIAAAFIYPDKDEANSDKVAPTEVEIAQQEINLDPPTTVEKTEADIQKDKIIQESANSNKPSADGTRAVSPVITYAQQDGQTITVNSYVSGVIEDGGVCTAKFVKDSFTVLKTSHGTANAGNTVCAPIFVDSSEFKTSGEWNLTIAYKSPSATGNSTAKIISIR